MSVFAKGLLDIGTISLPLKVLTFIGNILLARLYSPEILGLSNVNFYIYSELCIFFAKEVFRRQALMPIPASEKRFPVSGQQEKKHRGHMNKKLESKEKGREEAKKRGEKRQERRGEGLGAVEREERRGERGEGESENSIQLSKRDQFIHGQLYGGVQAIVSCLIVTTVVCFFVFIAPEVIKTRGLETAYRECVILFFASKIVEIVYEPSLILCSQCEQFTTRMQMDCLGNLVKILCSFLFYFIKKLISPASRPDAIALVSFGLASLCQSIFQFYFIHQKLRKYWRQDNETLNRDATHETAELLAHQEQLTTDSSTSLRDRSHNKKTLTSKIDDRFRIPETETQLRQEMRRIFDKPWFAVPFALVTWAKLEGKEARHVEYYARKKMMLRTEVFSSLLKILMQEMDKLAVLQFLSPTDKGAYAIAQSIGGIIVRLVFLPLEDLVQNFLLSSPRDVSLSQHFNINFSPVLDFFMMVCVSFATLASNFCHIAIFLMHGKSWASNNSASIFLNYYILSLIPRQILMLYEKYFTCRMQSERKKSFLLYCVSQLSVTVLFYAVSSVLTSSSVKFSNPARNLMVGFLVASVAQVFAVIATMSKASRQNVFYGDLAGKFLIFGRVWKFLLLCIFHHFFISFIKKFFHPSLQLYLQSPDKSPVSIKIVILREIFFAGVAVLLFAALNFRSIKFFTRQVLQLKSNSN